MTNTIAGLATRAAHMALRMASALALFSASVGWTSLSAPLAAQEAGEVRPDPRIQEALDQILRGSIEGVHDERPDTLAEGPVAPAAAPIDVRITARRQARQAGGRMDVDAELARLRRRLGSLARYFSELADTTTAHGLESVPTGAPLGASAPSISPTGIPLDEPSGPGVSDLGRRLDDLSDTPVSSSSGHYRAGAAASEADFGDGRHDEGAPVSTTAATADAVHRDTPVRRRVTVPVSGDADLEIEDPACADAHAFLRTVQELLEQMALRAEEYR